MPLRSLLAGLLLFSARAFAQERGIPVEARGGPLEVRGPFLDPPRPQPPGGFPPGQDSDDLPGASDDGAGVSGGTAEPQPPPSPALTTDWQAGAFGNGGQDPQIAAGQQLVGVLSWGKLCFYTKAGIFVSAQPGFANCTNMQSFFKPLAASISANLNLPAATQNLPQFQMDYWGDARITYDDLRGRWVIVATAKNTAPGKKPPLGVSKSEALASRRTKILLAVSKAEDPRKGFYKWWTDGTPFDGACNVLDGSACPGTIFRPGDAGDYPLVATGFNDYVISIRVGHYVLPSDATGLGDDKNIPFVQLFKADELTSPGPQLHSWQFYDIKLDGKPLDFIVAPVHQHEISSGNSYFVASWCKPTTKPCTPQLAVMGATETFPPELFQARADVQASKIPPLAPAPLADSALGFGSAQVDPLNAVLRFGKLHAVTNDCVVWPGQSSCAAAIHYMSVGMADFFSGKLTVERDRAFGLRNTADDGPADVVWYGWPGIGVNENGDVAIVYQRTSPMVLPEARYSVWMHDESDLRPSAVLHAGEGIPSKTFRADTAGAAIDPFDNNGIWIAHDWCTFKGSWRMAVGKVFGAFFPDINIPIAKFSPKSAHAGRGFEVRFSVDNTGDGDARGGRATVFLEGGRLERPLAVGEAALPPVASGDSVQSTVNAVILATLPPGEYRVRVRAQLADQREYSTDDDDALAEGTLRVVAGGR